MYISKRDFGGECLDLSVEPEMDITKYGIGKKVQVVAVGVVKSARAPYKGEDYDQPYKEGKKRPIKTYPGRLEIDLEGKPEVSDAPQVESGIYDLTKMMDADDLPGD